MGTLFQPDPRNPRQRLHADSSLKIWRVRLTAALAAGGSATAKRLDWQGNDTYSVSSSVIDVYDSLGNISGAVGDDFFAVYMLDSGHWEVFPGGEEGIPVKNANAGTAPARGLAYVTGIDTTVTPAALTVDQIGTTFKRDFVVLGAADIASGAYGLAQPGPYVIVKYTGSPAVGDGFGPKESVWTVAEGQPYLFSCLGIVDSTNNYMRARMGDLTTMLVKTTSSVSAGGASGGAPATTTSYNIYVDTSTASGFSVVPTAYNYGPSIASGLWCALTWINKQWVITALQCA